MDKATPTTKRVTNIGTKALPESRTGVTITGIITFTYTGIITPSLTLVITMVYEAPKSSSPSSRGNSPVSVMHFPLLYLDKRMKESISQLVPQTKNTEVSNMPLKWSREDARCKDTVVFISDSHWSSCYLVLPEALRH